MIRRKDIIRTLKKVFGPDRVASMAILLANATTSKREKEEQKKSRSPS